MDTDDLSMEAYKAIIIESETFNRDLTLRFGLLASSCKNEKEYLDNAKKIISEIRNLDRHSLSDLFFGSLPDKHLLNLALDKISNNIEKVEKIPENERQYEF